MFCLNWSVLIICVLNLFNNLNLSTSYIEFKKMNVFHSCNGTIFSWGGRWNVSFKEATFMRWEMKCSIQLGFALLNETFHLSPHENICSIAFINIICIPLGYIESYLNEKPCLRTWRKQFFIDTYATLFL